MRYILAILLIVFSTHIWAEEGQAFDGLALSKAPIDRSDMESIKRGAKFFAANCMSCHTLIYLKYDPLAQEAGITYDKMPVNVKNWPNGITPPDLSLEAEYRGVNWIYTYLHSFYNDPARASGVNNLLVPNTGMPGIIVPFQGQQELSKTPPASGVMYHDYKYYDLLVMTKQGTMSPEEFDKTTADLVNFLAYAAAPYHVEQHRIGWWVLGFLVILFVLMYLLKKEYWKDVKRHKDESDKHNCC